MVTIPVRVSEDLAARLIPLQDRLPQIIELGLRHWPETPVAPLTPRQRVEQIWAATGLVVSLDPALVRRYAKARKRQPPLRVGGQPASEIIIEQRGPR